MKLSLNKLTKELGKLDQEKNEKYYAVAQLERKLMDCVGPRKLQNLIETRRKHGIPLPFKVSIRKHSRYALVEYTDEVPVAGGEEGNNNINNNDMFSIDEELGVELTQEQRRQQLEEQRKERSERSGRNIGISRDGNDTVSIVSHQPGEWRKKLKVQDHIYLKGVEYQVVTAMNQKKKSSKSKKGGKADNSDGKDNSEGGPDNSETKKKKKVGTGVDTSDPSNKRHGDSSGGKDNSASDKPKDSSASGKDHSGMAGAAQQESLYKMFDEPVEGQELQEEVTLNHIALDHPWMLDDVYGMEVYKLPSMVFYEKPVHSVKKFCLKLYFTQKFVAIMAIICHKWSRLFEWLVTFFDEESSSYRFCHGTILSSIKSRNYFLSLSIYIIVLSFDFTLRRKIGKQVYKVYLLLAMICRNFYNIYKTVTSNLQETPYEYWQRSLEKENVKCIYEMSSNDSIVLGEFRMDIKAPIEIMREYICRNFRAELNKSIGDSFIFFRLNPTSGKEEYCDRNDEFKIHAKEFALLQTDAKTFESILTVTIVKDKERGKVLIPEYKDDFDDLGSVEKKKGDDAENDEQDNGSLA
jgi:hypothetical protein